MIIYIQLIIVFIILGFFAVLHIITLLLIEKIIKNRESFFKSDPLDNRKQLNRQNKEEPAKKHEQSVVICKKCSTPYMAKYGICPKCGAKR